jgi:hypothetical protein
MRRTYKVRVPSKRPALTISGTYRGTYEQHAESRSQSGLCTLTHAYQQDGSDAPQYVSPLQTKYWVGTHSHRHTSEGIEPRQESTQAVLVSAVFMHILTHTEYIYSATRSKPILRASWKGIRVGCTRPMWFIMVHWDSDMSSVKGYYNAMVAYSPSLLILVKVDSPLTVRRGSERYADVVHCSGYRSVSV